MEMPKESKNEKMNGENIQSLLDYYSGYHHHKESMAYAGLGVQIAIFSGIMITEKWPMEGFGHWCHKWPIWGCFFILWMLIHGFVGWQLMNRRYAAKVIGACIRYAHGHISNKNTICSKTSNHQKNLPCCVRKTVNCLSILVWPLGGWGTTAEIIKPSEFARLIKEQKPGTKIEETIFLVGSIMMAIMICVRTYYEY